jgi:hypothetical protein
MQMVAIVGHVTPTLDSRRQPLHWIVIRLRIIPWLANTVIQDASSATPDNKMSCNTVWPTVNVQPATRMRTRDNLIRYPIPDSAKIAIPWMGSTLQCSP